MEDIPLASKSSKQVQKNLQESHEKVGMETKDKEQKKQAPYTDALEDYLDSFQLMQKSYRKCIR
jgi:hypothetical protein